VLRLSRGRSRPRRRFALFGFSSVTVRRARRTPSSHDYAPVLSPVATVFVDELRYEIILLKPAFQRSHAEHAAFQIVAVAV
jgi:hypothetical protein